jgi:hypothetical protein
MKVLRYHDRARQPVVSHEGACVLRGSPGVSPCAIDHNLVGWNTSAHQILAHGNSFIDSGRTNAAAHKD